MGPAIDRSAAKQAAGSVPSPHLPTGLMTPPSTAAATSRSPAESPSLLREYAGREALEDWVRQTARLTRPEQIVWCDGTNEEFQRLTEQMVAAGTLHPLSPEHHPRSFLARSDPRDVARVEDRTFICSRNETDAGPTNHWFDPAAMHARLDELFAGCMAGRTMYVLPYLLGPQGGTASRVGVELTDSPYVAASMRIMTRMGRPALDRIDRGERFTRGLHSRGQLDPSARYIAHFPEENLVRSFGSDYGGNALLAKKCHALRLASVQARQEGWLAEHMLIVGITDPTGQTTWIAAAFPSACGKTNLAMLVPSPEDHAAGWRVETLGDDIAWLHPGEDGRLWAINPESGLFGVAPGTSSATNPRALAACSADTIFTNVALTPQKTVWWEGLGPAPPSCWDWRGEPWTPDAGTPAAHPNSRFTTPLSRVPSLSSAASDPRGVAIDAILFGGRRATLLPLVHEPPGWAAGVYTGATLSSETTAAAVGATGEVRFDPLAMLPFCGYHMGDYFAHWLSLGDRRELRLPRLFHVNWFRKGARGNYLWPGFGQNLKVLEWIVRRCRESDFTPNSPLGRVPTIDELQFAAAGVSPADAAELLRVDPTQWTAELTRREAFLERFEDRLPAALWQEHHALRSRLTVSP